MPLTLGLAAGVWAPARLTRWARPRTDRMRARAVRATAGSVVPHVSEGVARLEEFARRPGKKAVFQAAQSGVITVEEGKRPLREYMGLPPSQYSVLDAQTVTRIDDNTFKCELAELNFFGFKVQPVLTAQVDVLDEGAGTIIRVTDAHIGGSEVAEAASDTFMVVSENEVGWRDAPEGDGNMKEITSETAVAVHLILPSWLPFSVEATERTGNFVMRQVMEQVVPRFLGQLKEDFDNWTNGDDSRAAVSSGELFDVEVEANT